MGKILFLIIILFAIFFIGKQIYLFGQSSGKKEAKRVPIGKNNIDRAAELQSRIDKINTEIESAEEDNLHDEQETVTRLDHLKEERAKLQELKKKYI